MTLEEYISNPMGVNNATFNPFVRESIKNKYKHIYDNIMLRENGKIAYYLYADTENNVYYIHVKVPSENVKNFYYDIIYKFFTSSDQNTGAGENLKKYQVQFFANDPAFVYTHAHTYIEKGLFINELTDLMSQQAVLSPATEKNPNDSVGYVKTIYLAYLFIEHRNLLKKIYFRTAEKYNKEIMAQKIVPADTMLEMRAEEEKKRDKRKKLVIDKNLAQQLKKYDLTDKAKERLVVTTPKTVKTKNTKAVNTIKATKQISSIIKNKK